MTTIIKNGTIVTADLTYKADVRIEGAEMASNRRRLSEILALHCGQPYAKVDADVERNFYLSADDAVAYGLVDKVLPMSKK